MQIFAGAMSGIRDPKVHAMLRLMCKSNTLSAPASLLMAKLDEGHGYRSLTTDEYLGTSSLIIK